MPVEVVAEPTPDTVEISAEQDTAEEVVEPQEAPVEQEPAGQPLKSRRSLLKNHLRRWIRSMRKLKSKSGRRLMCNRFRRRRQVRKRRQEGEAPKRSRQETPAPVTLKEKKPKKVKKDSAAKIIQLPVKPVEKPLGENCRQHLKNPGAKLSACRRVHREQSLVCHPKELPAKETKKKKSKQRPDEEVAGNKKFLKKKISFRKKSVIRGSRLYTVAAIEPVNHARVPKAKRLSRDKKLKLQQPKPSSAVSKSMMPSFSPSWLKEWELNPVK